MKPGVSWPNRHAQGPVGDDAAARRGLALPWWARGWWPAVWVAAATFVAYWPCLRGEFVWDDDAWTLNLARLFQSLSGLGEIWVRPTALQQYYPLTASTFWIDYRLWGFWTLPYHVENVLLHLLAAWLFWKLLRRLEVPGAGLAAIILALHPLMVESVAWITERKNVLALVLFLGALLVYGRAAGFWKDSGVSPAPRPGAILESPFGVPPSGGSPALKPPEGGTPNGALKPPEGGTPNGERASPLSSHARGYVWALLLFLGAYLAKATTFAFPAVVLLICWWKRGRMRWREDVAPTLPFFAISISLGLATSWLERNHVGASGPDWEITFADRCCIAGHALWFYVAKLLWPADLCFIYPRWELAGGPWVKWLWPITALAVLMALWLLRRRIGRGPLAAVLFYAGTLFPLLGFINGYFMRYSFVCDHWCYLPSLGLIALGAALAARLAARQRRLVGAAAGLVLTAFAALTFLQSGMYRNAETLYRTTLAKNPKADLVHNNLGLLLAQADQMDEAIEHFQRAVELRPTSAHAHNNLANSLRLMGRLREAIGHYETSLKLEPENPSTCVNLAALLTMGPEADLRDRARGLELAQRANQLARGRNPVVLSALGAVYADNGRLAEAAAAVRQALELAARGTNRQLIEALQRQLADYENGSPAPKSAQ